MRTYRHELKYFMSEVQYQGLRPALASLFERDPHTGEKGEYMIRSLYFDDMYQSAYEEKQSGIYARKKYRIRIYNCWDQAVYLECKYKQGAYISKESLALTRREYQKLRQGETEFLFKKDSQMAREFALDSRTKILRPKVIVDYDREPYVLEAGNLRITFDKGLRAAEPQGDIFDPKLTAYGALAPGQMVLEIKFTGYLPEKARRIFRLRDLPQCSASKYCLCADRIRGKLWTE